MCSWVPYVLLDSGLHHTGQGDLRACIEMPEHLLMSSLLRAGNNEILQPVTCGG